MGANGSVDRADAKLRDAVTMKAFNSSKNFDLSIIDRLQELADHLMVESGARFCSRRDLLAMLDESGLQAGQALTDRIVVRLFGEGHCPGMSFADLRGALDSLQGSACAQPRRRQRPSVVEDEDADDSARIEELEAENRALRAALRASEERNGRLRLELKGAVSKVALMEHRVAYFARDVDDDSGELSEQTNTRHALEEVEPARHVNK